MRGFRVEEIKDLFSIDCTSLLTESKNEGFRFLERLITDYRNGTNNFSKPGESLYGVFNKEGLLVAIAGLNIDPFSNAEKIGRLRRFYVCKDYRRYGIGSVLLNTIIDNAKRHYETLVLHTDTEQAEHFYVTFGFIKEDRFINSTHYLDLQTDKT